MGKACRNFCAPEQTAFRNTRATGASTKPLWNWYTTATCSTKDTTVVGGEKRKAAPNQTSLICVRNMANAYMYAKFPT